MTTAHQSQSRQKDCFDTPGKQAMREHNLAIVRGASCLWNEHKTQLRCDWAELAGDSVSLTLETLESQKVLRPGGFIGIDNKSARIGELRAARPDLKWLAGDLRHSISWLTTQAEVGVLVFDGYLEVGTVESRAFFSAIRPLAQRSIKAFGSFVLFSNNCLDSVWRHPGGPHGGQPSVALQMHTAGVVEELQSYFPRRTLRVEDLLPAGFETKANDGTYEGTLGGYRIYAGSKQNLRMIELGLVL